MIERKMVYHPSFFWRCDFAVAYDGCIFTHSTIPLSGKRPSRDKDIGFPGNIARSLSWSLDFSLTKRYYNEYDKGKAGKPLHTSCKKIREK